MSSDLVEKVAVFVIILFGALIFVIGGLIVILLITGELCNVSL